MLSRFVLIFFVPYVHGFISMAVIDQRARNSKSIHMNLVNQLKPFFPIVGFYSVMLAPIYGNGIIGSPTNFDTISPRGSPNEAIYCPRGYCPNYPRHQNSPTFDVSKDVLRKSWEKMISKQPRVQRVFIDDESDRIAYVQRSFKFRWPDVITVKFVEVGPKQSSLATHSYSIYGYGDLGVNSERLRTWLDQTEELLEEPN